MSASIVPQLRRIVQTAAEDDPNTQYINFGANVIEAIAGLHFAVMDDAGVTYCYTCGTKFTWPCPTEVVLQWNL